MALEITVRPVGDHWNLIAPGFGVDLLFASGARAEAEGRELARRLAAEGRDAELVIVVRGGEVAGRLAFPAEVAA